MKLFLIGEMSLINITIVDTACKRVFPRCFVDNVSLKAPVQNLLKGGIVTSGSGETRKRRVEEMEGKERREGEGWTEGSLKAQCVRENRSVPSPRQPTAQAH